MNNRKKYPRNWRKLARACKERAGWQCKECKVLHGTLRLSWAGRPYPVYMVAAHKNHDPFNPSPDLECVCPSCHFRFYRRQGQPAVWVIERMKHRKLLGKPLTARG
ncbi:MAG TPA: hypothetical protein VEL31_17840 [Ktedonobacteraceae bacterium]|nr:hypothetical protein [Ktedonobacteraceae bacterium]